LLSQSDSNIFPIHVLWLRVVVSIVVRLYDLLPETTSALFELYICRNISFDDFDDFGTAGVRAA
jgi:hypothetical protein